jgi:hypothetical protein
MVPFLLLFQSLIPLHTHFLIFTPNISASSYFHQTSLLTLLTLPTYTSLQNLKQSIKAIIQTRDTQSIHVQFIHATSPRMSRISEDENGEEGAEGGETGREGEDDEGEKKVLHLTPIWGREVSFLDLITCCENWVCLLLRVDEKSVPTKGRISKAKG